MSAIKITGRPKAFIHTLGCPKNEADSIAMSERLAAAGYEIVNELSDADIALINTCSFIQAATEESIECVLDVVNDDDVISNKVPTIVCGCMPSRYGAHLKDELVEAAAFLPCEHEGEVVKIANGCLGIDDDYLSNICDTQICDKSADEGLLTAYVKISDGCSRNCAYCTIPQIRGPYKSYGFDHISKEVGKRISLGAKEIILIGQDTGIWGKDLPACDSGPNNLASLLDALAMKHSSIWFRVMYTQPESINAELLDIIAKHENICPYLDIPMQHCQENILSAMNRKGSPESLIELVNNIRSRIPGVAIRTTLMCGFPGETEEDFDALLDFVQEAEFDYVGVFSYSPEEGTKAASLPNQINDCEKQSRANELRDLADSISSRIISQRTGSILNVLVEGVEEDGQIFGRAMQQAPDVDGLFFIESAHLGSVVAAKVEDTLLYDMEGSIVS